MKRLIIIGIAFVFLLSGMHITIATHFCGGKIAAVKVSLSGIKAGCGMESDESSSTSHEPQVGTRCCYDEMAVYKVDSQYAPSAFAYKLIPQNTMQLFFIPQGVFLTDLYCSQADHTIHGPPEPFAVSAVNPSEICTFRI
jgi:hypothetical protein